MSKLDEYNPIQSFSIPGVEAIPARGLIVVVGPNSSGKTLLLRDLEQTLLDPAAKPVVCTGIGLVRPPHFETFIDDLRSRHLLRQDEGNSYSIFAHHAGAGVPGGAGSKAHDKLYRRYEESDRNPPSLREFLAFFGRTLLASLFIDKRRDLIRSGPRQPGPTDPPQNDLQALHLDQDAQDRLTHETSRVFGNAAWLDTTRGDACRLRVSESPKAPPFRDRLDMRKVEAVPLIDREGDGYKSYVAIVIALLLGRRPVCLIDEPEMCLHPPQAYELGKFIGEYGTSEHHATFVATHSSHVLRGVLERARRLTVLRLTRVAPAFHGHVVPDEELRQVVRKPSTRAETILDGIFAEAVAVVEAEGDRAVYQAAMESNDNDFGRQVHFVPVSGSGGIAEVCRFYRGLRIPVAVIADLDVVCDGQKRKACLDALADPQETESTLKSCREVVQAIRDIPPVLTPDAAKKELREIAGAITSWDNEADEALRRQLSALTKKVARLRRLKDGGPEAYAEHPAIKQGLEQIIEACKAVGLFLVPCGELEGWVPDLMKGVPKDYKPEWAEQAAALIRQHGPRADGVWGFVNEVLEYLRRAKTG